ELRHLQAKLAAQYPYRRAAAILGELLPNTGGLNHATTRNRTLAIGKRMEQEIREEIAHPTVVPDSAQRMVVGSMAHLSRPTTHGWRKAINLRLSPGASKQQRVIVRHSRWSGIWISKPSNGCKRFFVVVAAVRTRT